MNTPDPPAHPGGPGRSPRPPRPLSVLPGLGAVLALAAAATWLSERLGSGLPGFERSPVSPITTAVILGLIVGNVIRLPPWLKPGLSFSVKRLLRLGIILLGIRLSVFEAFRLGVAGIPIVVICVGSALVVTAWLNRRLRMPPRLGALIAAGTSICGISAVVATGPAIGADEEEMAYAVTTITVFGVVALIAYPYLAHALLGPDAAKVGLFLGTAIHDTSQVTGAGLAYSQMFDAPRALDVATVTKLVRNVFLVAVVPLMTFAYSRPRPADDGRPTRLRSLVPWFVVGFVALAAVRSVGDAGVAAEAGRAFGLFAAPTWSGLVDFVADRAADLLLLALCGVGLSADFRAMRALGFKPLAVGLGAAVTVGVVGFAAISVLGGFVG